jgi:NADH:ubiquinone oxidoreductase subunit F (NADH-binding)
MTAATAGAFHDDASRAVVPNDLPRLLPPVQDGKRSQDLAAHLARHGDLPYRDRVGAPSSPGALIGDIEKSGLTGRGGAAFPVHRKLAAVLEAADRRRRAPTVIANGAESEPASDKDATLLWLAPHLVLDGLQLAAEALGADTAILVTHADREHDVAGRVRQALQERLNRRLDRVPVQLAVAPARFLSGQETALVNHLGGGPSVPTFMPPRITERGLNTSPTLVQNVETLAHLALIARRGPGWFREVGTAAEPGSMLATIRRADGQPKITEVPLGIPIRNLLGDAPPTPTPTQQTQLQTGESAVLLGGYHGMWLPAARAAGLTLDNRSLEPAGARVGAGIVISLPADRCGLVETARVVRYLALESAGQCGPCLNGLPRIAAAFVELATGRPRPRTVEDLQRWSGLVAGRGACHHPDGTARFVRSALLTFAAEVDRHSRGQCSATNTAPFLPIPTAAARTEDDWT